MKYNFIILRILLAMVLFLMMAQSNLWADTEAHLVLAVGYRAFLLATPFFVHFGYSRGMSASLLLGIVALGLAYFSFNAWALGLFALSMAVSGYICKFSNSQTTKGAADNKVALNIGSLAAGFLILMTQQKDILIGLSIVALLAALFFSTRIKWDLKKEMQSPPIAKKKINFLHLAGWSLIGVATGIKLTGVFTILPQYLIHKMGILPNWFGTMLIINSLGVIFVQHRVLNYMGRSKRNLTLWLSTSAMILLAIPAFFHVEKEMGAILWIGLLTLGECALSHYDTVAKNQGYLFPKELMVGVGSFLTVYLGREFPEWSALSGSLGTVCLLIGFALTKTSFLFAFIFDRKLAS